MVFAKAATWNNSNKKAKGNGARKKNRFKNDKKMQCVFALGKAQVVVDSLHISSTKMLDLHITRSDDYEGRARAHTTHT